MAKAVYVVAAEVIRESGFSEVYIKTCGTAEFLPRIREAYERMIPQMIEAGCFEWWFNHWTNPAGAICDGGYTMNEVYAALAEANIVARVFRRLGLDSEARVIEASIEARYEELENGEIPFEE